jgi:alpha-beta hydrolase superfamily lysophospholipase
MASSTRTVPAADGTELLARHWQAGAVPWATVVLVHGLGEHSGRYEHVGDRLAAAGLDVRAFDLRGFGASGGQRAGVESFEVFHDDLAEQLAGIRATAEERPIVLYGHSMGGLVALGYIVSARPSPDLLVLSAPGLDSTIPAWKFGLARLLAAVAPRLMIANGLKGSQLSRDPNVGAAYFADPLNRHTSSARFADAGRREMERVRSSAPRLSIPTLAIHGEDDTIVPVGASALLAGLPGVTLVTYPGLRHEVHNEPEWSSVMDDVVGWLRLQVSRAT